ncbi:MAG: hypothetical protein WCF44_06165 [Candidatus Methylophosphatis roskildensis]
MSRRDIDLALRLIAEWLPHLRQPRRLNPRAFAPGRRVLGQYRLLTDSLRLNARYLDDLDDMQALDLLDTLLHELLHGNSGLLRQVRDSFRPHPDIWHQAGRLRDLLADEFLTRRGAGDGDS